MQQRLPVVPVRVQNSAVQEMSPCGSPGTGSRASHQQSTAVTDAVNQIDNHGDDVAIRYRLNKLLSRITLIDAKSMSVHSHVLLG